MGPDGEVAGRMPPDAEGVEAPSPEEVQRADQLLAVGGRVAEGLATLAVGPHVGSAVAVPIGVAVERVFVRVGADVYDRLFARRQLVRAGSALACALGIFRKRLEREVPRQDGFFHPGPDGRSEAEEVLEGTLLAAANAHQERKVPFIARMFPNSGFDSSVSAAHANFLLRLADRLTYRQLQTLAFFARAQAGPWERALIAARPMGDGRLPDPTLIAEMNDLADSGLLGVRHDNGQARPLRDLIQSISGFTPQLVQGAVLLPIGETLHRLMQLDEVPDAELEEILAAIRG